MVKVSVLITTYNLENYIEETLNSVLRQKTNFEYEILVGDDGSTDATVDIVERISEKSHVSIKVYKMSRDRSKKYNSIYRASRNRLNILKYAKGDYITFLDGDDLYLSDSFLQKGYDVLSKKKEYIMCGCDLVFYREGETSNRRAIGNSLQKGEISKRKYWRGYYVPAECFLYRNIYKQKKSILMNHNVFDDNLIIFYFMKFGKMYYINEAMVAYRQNRTEWKKKSKLKQHLYSAMDVYEELRITSGMFPEIFIRHFDELLALLEEIPKLQLASYNEERLLCKKNKYTIIYWILCYDRVNVLKKMFIHMLSKIFITIGYLRDLFC